MLNSVRYPAYLQFATACVAGAFVVIAAAPTIADEQFAPTAVVQLPDSQILSAFDISFVDPKTHTYALAASRVVGSDGALGRVIIVNTSSDVVVKEIGTGHFVGDCSVPPARDTISGPNGVIVIEKGPNADVWAADGPVFNTACKPASGLKTPSTLKVFNLHTGALKATIPTGTGTGTNTPGNNRADELCFNPVSDVVLIANADDPNGGFVTFVGEDSFKVLERIRFDGSDSDGHDPFKILASGIEQCAFNPRDGKFYLNIPMTGATGTGPGFVLRISAHAPFVVEQAFKIDPTATGCAGPQGMAIGPDHQIGLGCGGTNSLIIDDRNGSTVKIVTGEGGTDEMWFNPGSNHYFFARSTAAKLGVEDAGPPPSADSDAATATGSHSVAADSRTNQVFVPIRGNNGTVPPSTTGKICSSAKDVHGNAGSDALGCIAIYTAPSDSDDCRAGGSSAFHRGRCPAATAQ